MMRKHPTLRQSIFVLSAVCAFGNDRKRVPLVSSLPRKKKISPSCPISTEIHLLQLRRSFHHRGKVVCFSIESLAFPRDDDDDDEEKMMAPREKNERTKERSF